MQNDKKPTNTSQKPPNTDQKPANTNKKLTNTSQKPTSTNKKTKIIFSISYKYNFSYIFASTLFIAHKKVISKIIILVY